MSKLFFISLLALLSSLHGTTLVKVDDLVPCNGEKPLTDYSGKELYCGRGGSPCPAGSYCDIHPTDKYAKCCPQKVKPGKCPNINCFVSDCSQDSDCSGTRKCCNGCCAEPISSPCGDAKPLTDSSGVDLYCGRGGQRCPLGSYCDIHPADRYAKCCPNKVEDLVPCNGEKPLTGYSGKDLYCGRGGSPCPAGSYCDIHPTDKYAKCCPQKVKPGKCPTIFCFVSDCSQDSDCSGTRKCCNGCCAEPIDYNLLESKLK